MNWLKHDKRVDSKLTCSFWLWLCVLASVVSMVSSVSGQQLRFSNHRELSVPEYATVRVGPFYSTIKISQSAGYRYTRSSGVGTDFIQQNERGTIIKEGQEWPIATTLDLRNYLIVTRRSDLDVSVSANYRHYPLETQEDEFNVYLAEEGIFGNLSSEVELTPFVKAFLHDSFVYRTDYIDVRGLTDEYGGQRYEYMRNTVGIDMDWRLAREMNVGMSASRMDLVPRSDDFKDQERTVYFESLLMEKQLLPGLVAGIKAGSTQVDYAEPDRPDTRQVDYSFYGSAGFARDKGVGFQITEASVLSVGFGTSLGYAYDYDVSQTASDVDETESVYEGDSDQASFSASAALKTRMSKTTLQTISYDKGLRGGFSSAFEAHETYGYDFKWKGLASSVGLYSRYSFVEPSNDDETEYRDWISGINASYPLVSYITMMFSSTYSTRENLYKETGSTSDTKWLDEFGIVTTHNDYSTWISSIGTSFAVTRSIKFSVSARHVERMSDIETLEYSRDIVTADLLYAHQF